MRVVTLCTSDVSLPPGLNSEGRGSVACRDQRQRKRKSSILWAISAKRVWLSLDWLNSRPSGLFADTSERWLKRWTRREGGNASLPPSLTLLADPLYEEIGTNGSASCMLDLLLLKRRDDLNRGQSLHGYGGPLLLAFFLSPKKVSGREGLVASKRPTKLRIINCTLDRC